MDIPGDNANGHGAAIVFVQDTCDQTQEPYEVFGISSLDYSQYTWLSDPDQETFTEATWPSLAIHNSTGTTASATYFGYEDSSWETWAVEWNIADAGDISSPTYVDVGANGEFSLSVPEFMFHNWGTSSSLVDLDQSNHNMFWAAWSDQIGGASSPNQVRGCVGYVD